ncbi:MAG: hypothetical protein ACK5ML_13460 [Lachnospiraceae bacterium]
MEQIPIKVRKEVIRCKKCHTPKDFFYLSDFAYGQRLVFLNKATEYAFVNLIEDEVYTEFINMIMELLKNENLEISEEKINTFVDLVFGETCDNIHGFIVDFSKSQRQCSKCGSHEYERNMIEPESLVEIKAYPITHCSWKNKSEYEKKEIIRNALNTWISGDQ